MFLVVKMDFGSVEKYWGLKQKHKKQPFSDASASHLSLVLWHVWFQAGAWISHTTTLTPPSYEVGGIAKRIKTARLRRKTKPGRDTSRPPIILILYWISIIWHGREISRPYHTKSFLGDLMRLLSKKSFYHQGFFAVNGERFLSLGQCGMPSWEGGGGIVWLAAWKLVFNDAKRTVAPPNAKHSTLLQDCFLCFCFLFHWRFGNKA